MVIYYRIFILLYTLMKLLCRLENFSQYHLLFLRIALLFVFFARGWPKLIWGVDRWIWLGQAMSVYGITFFPAFRWFMATYAESIAVLFIAAGFFTRFHSFLLAFTLLTAMITKLIAEGWIERLADLWSAYLIFVVAFTLMLTWAWPILNLEKKLFGKEY